MIFRYSTSNTEAAVQMANQPTTGNTDVARPDPLSIQRIESSLPPRQGTMTDFTGHVEKRKENKFIFKKYKELCKEGERGGVPQAGDALLRMVGGSIGEKKKEEDKVIGIAFVARSSSIRHLYCPHCKKFLHRDVMAGHNIVNILKSHVEKQERQLYLQPVDKDSNHLWLERGHQSAALARDAPAPSQQEGSSGSGARRNRKIDNGDEAHNEKDSKHTKAIIAKSRLSGNSAN
ncbi:hypothetical protein BG004_002513 [Podila humilis]|nr:hypothetical protein BG004_002513 [Podila humilis]